MIKAFNNILAPSDARCAGLHSWRQQPGTPAYCRDLDVNGLKTALAAADSAEIAAGEVIRNMRLSIKRSQSEYAQLCGVSPRVLADVEAGGSNPTLKTLQALLLPFACGIGVVAKRTS